METEVPKKRYVVKNWQIRLKSGSLAEFNLREDQGDKFVGGEEWWVWTVVKPNKHESNIRYDEIAAWDYEEIEREELSLYKPKKGMNAKTTEGVSIGRDSAGEAAYVSKTQRDETV